MPPRAFPTHFLCVPLVTPVSRPQLVQSLGAFAADVTSPSSFGIPPEAIRPVGTIHLTLGVFSFPRNEGLQSAIELLKALKAREFLATPSKEAGESLSAAQQRAGPLSITLRGLVSMQTASKTSVIYAPPVDQPGALQHFCEKVKSAFEEAGLLMEDNRPLLLHATIVNTVYVKDGKRRGRRGDKLTIDARGVLDRYDDQVWMENVPVDKIAICKMGAKKTEVDGVEDEVYEVVAEIDF